MSVGFGLTNGSLLIFFCALLAAGLVKGTYAGDSFQEMMTDIEPFLLTFAISGVGLMAGLWLVLLPAIGWEEMLPVGREVWIFHSRLTTHVCERLLTALRARAEGIPKHRVEYAIDSYRIEPTQRGGIIRLFDADKVDVIRSALRRIANRQEGW